MVRCNRPPWRPGHLWPSAQQAVWVQSVAAPLRAPPAGAAPGSARLASHASTSGSWISLPNRVFSWLQPLPEGLLASNLEPVPLLYPSPRPPSLFKLFFPPSLNFSHPSARLLHSSQPIGGSHSRRGSAPCTRGANPPLECRVLGLIPKRLACDGSAPSAARREGAGPRVRAGRGRGEG